MKQEAGYLLLQMDFGQAKLHPEQESRSRHKDGGAEFIIILPVFWKARLIGNKQGTWRDNHLSGFQDFKLSINKPGFICS